MHFCTYACICVRILHECLLQPHRVQPAKTMTRACRQGLDGAVATGVQPIPFSKKKWLPVWCDYDPRQHAGAPVFVAGVPAALPIVKDLLSMAQICASAAWSVATPVPQTRRHLYARTECGMACAPHPHIQKERHAAGHAAQCAATGYAIGQCDTCNSTESGTIKTTRASTVQGQRCMPSGFAQLGKLIHVPVRFHSVYSSPLIAL